MAVRCREIFNIIEKLAPCHLAEKWDNTGLQAGNPGQVIDKALITLDVNIHVAREARDIGAGLILSHHPMLMAPVKSVSMDTPGGELLAFIIRNDITVYAAHTNLDAATGGVSDALARKLDLSELTVLQPSQSRYLKLAVFVPVGHDEKVRSSMAEAGAGWIGNYSSCFFFTRGTGTFKPAPGTRPFIGKTGELEQVEEVKVETIVPAYRLDAVLEAMQKAHPYEEVAYDLYQLENICTSSGLGRVGILPEPLPLQRFAEKVKAALGQDAVRFGGPPDIMVKRVAVCSGSGADFWPAALRAGADTLVTGDVKYHTAQDILAAGLNFIDAGHHGTEAVILPVLKDHLDDWCAKEKKNIVVVLSQINTNPFTYVLG